MPAPMSTSTLLLLRPHTSAMDSMICCTPARVSVP
jgi:hypothetical protein